MMRWTARVKSLRGDGPLLIPRGFALLDAAGMPDSSEYSSKDSIMLLSDAPPDSRGLSSENNAEKSTKRKVVKDESQPGQPGAAETDGELTPTHFYGPLGSGSGNAAPTAQTEPSNLPAAYAALRRAADKASASK